MVAAKRDAGTTDAIVYALEHRFLGRCIRTPQHYETDPLSASHLLALRCTNTVGHYLKKICVSR